MDFRVLGPLGVFEGDRAVELGGPKQRAVLGHLVLHAEHVVPIDRLIDEVWGEEPPDAVMASLQATISRLRRLIGSDRIEGRPAGYVLRARPEEIDASRFERLVREARRLLATYPRRATVLLGHALAMWHGEPLNDVPTGPLLRADITALDELRLAAIDDYVALQLALGNEVEVIGEIESWVAENPLRERLWAQLMTALYRAGRQADALAAYNSARRQLSDELGIEPSAELEQLQLQILRHDPALAVRGLPLRGYLLLERIGEGTFGVVHRAIQPGVGREVALKAVQPRLAHHPDFVRRFEAEAQLVARLEHPHIVPLYDYWRDADGAYLVMRWLRGGSLKQLLSDGPLDTVHAARVTEEVAAALAAAHRVGVIHRDVKPANILLDEEGNAYLSDFGIARDLATTEAAAAAADETTRYLSPEEVRGEPVTPRTDIYALGVVLYEMLAGHHPLERIRDEQSRARPSLLRPELPRALDEVIACAMAPKPAERHADVDELVSAVRQVLRPPAFRVIPAELPAEPPYKGLRPFGEPDAEDFFGREALIEELVERLSQPAAGGRFLAVVGASGSGKSSVVRAGLLPALRRGAAPGSERWFIAEMYPGSDPLAQLADALQRVAPDPPAGLRRLIGGDPRALARVVDELLPAGTEMLLVVDQFEELFTLTTDGAARDWLLDAITHAASAKDSRLRTVITLRADVFDRPLAHHQFGLLLRAQTALVVALSPEQLESAVSAPAARRGVTVEPSVVARIVADVADQPAALPLLQYALTEMYGQRRGMRLTLDEYRAIGGIIGAIARRADELYAASGAGGQEAARQVFLHLVTLGEGIHDARRRVRRSELQELGLEQASLDDVLAAFGSHRLLSFDRDPQTREPTVEVAHEALLREWPRLREWIDAAREDLRQERALASAAAEWLAAGHDSSFLLRGARLAQVEAWAATNRLALSQVEREYIAASQAEHLAAQAAEHARVERERALERRAVTRLRALVAVFAAGTLIAAGLAAFAFDQQARAEREARFAQARELAAAALANLGVDPDLAIQLALAGVEATRSTDGLVLREAEEALHVAVQSSRVVERRPPDGAVVLTRDGRHMAVNSGGQLSIREAQSAVDLAVLPIEQILRLAVSPDGRYVATSDTAGSFTIWDLRRDAERLVLSSGDRTTDFGAFSPDGSMFAAMTIDGVAQVWRIPGGQEVAEIVTAGADAPSGGGLTLSWHPDGHAIAVAGGLETVVADLLTAERHVLAGDGRTATYSPDGGLLLTTGQNTASLWRAADLERAFVLPGHVGFVDAASFSADGRLAATGAHDGRARVWDVVSGELLFDLPGLRGVVDEVHFAAGGSRLVGVGPDGTLVWDLTPAGSREVLTIAAHSDLAANITYDASGTRLGTASFDGRMRIWQAADGELLLDLPGTGPPAADIVFSPDGQMIATASFDGTAALWASDTGALIRRLEGHTAPVWAVAFSHDGERLVTVSEDQTARVWQADSGEVLTVFSEHTSFVYDAAWHPNGSLVVSVGNDEVGRVWDPATGSQIRVLAGHAGNVLEQAFSPDGVRIATASFDASAKVWEMATGEQLFTLAGHGGAVLDVEASPDGSRWATASFDGTVRLWDADSGRELLVLRVQPEPAGRLAFSPDSRHLAMATNDGLVRVVALEVDELIELGRQRVSRPLSEIECRQYLRLDTCPDGH